MKTTLVRLTLLLHVNVEVAEFKAGPGSNERLKQRLDIEGRRLIAGPEWLLRGLPESELKASKVEVINRDAGHLEFVRRKGINEENNENQS
jgi:hypothetical protein